MSPKTRADLLQEIEALRARVALLERAMSEGAPVDALGSPSDQPDQKALAHRKVGEAEEALRRSEAYFRTLSEQTLDLITILERDGRIRYQSPAVARWLDWAPDDVLGRSVFEFVHPDDAAGLRQRLEEDLGARGNTTRMEFRFRHRDGSWRTLEGIGKNLLDDPLIGGIIVNSRDVTDRARLEQELQQAQKMEAVGRLAGGIAHDFNNLLTIVIGRSQLVLGRLEPGDPLRRHLELIDRTGRRAATLIDQLLTFSRRQMVQPRMLDLNEAVRSIEPALRRLLGAPIAIEITTDPVLGHVHADTGQIDQVVLNLAANARDAMPEGGTLSIRTANVELDGAAAHRHGVPRAGGWVTLIVADTGRGMDAATRAHVFEPFFTTKTLGRGSGLGLSTVYGIVRQAGGHISVESEPGEGATFTIYLPRAEAPLETAAPGAPPAAGGRSVGTVLVVEDEPDVRTLASEILRAHGFVILEAGEAVEAERLAAAHRGPLHLLLADIVLPGLSGPALAARLAGIRPEMRVLYMSGYTDAVVGRGAADLGAPLVLKPFAPDELLRHVHGVLEAPRVP